MIARESMLRRGFFDDLGIMGLCIMVCLVWFIVF